MITLLWVIPLLVLVAVLAGMRGYKRGHDDGLYEGLAKCPPPICASSPIWTASDPGAFSFPVVAASYLLDEEGHLVTSADRYLEPPAEHPLT